MRPLRFLSALLLMGLLSSCSLITARRLRMDDLHGLIVSETSKKPRTLRVRGLIANSIDVATSIRSRVHGNCIELTLWAAWTDAEGPLDFDFVAPDSVDEVRLGTDHTLLWNREFGSKYPASRLEALKPHRKPDQKILNQLFSTARKSAENERNTTTNGSSVHEQLPPLASRAFEGKDENDLFHAPAVKNGFPSSYKPHQGDHETHPNFP